MNVLEHWISSAVYRYYILWEWTYEFNQVPIYCYANLVWYKVCMWDANFNVALRKFVAYACYHIASLQLHVHSQLVYNL